MQQMTGRLGKDPVTSNTNTGKTVAKVSMVITRGWGAKEQTQWVDLIAWESLAAPLQTYSKGDFITVAGEVNERPWTTNQGEQRIAVEMTVRGIYEPTHKDKPSNQQPAKQQKRTPPAEEIGMEDVPW